MKAKKWLGALLAVVFALTMGLTLAACEIILDDDPVDTKVTVTYYDGSTVIRTEKVEAGVTAPEFDPADVGYTKEGYHFVDWYKEAALLHEFDFTAPITQDTNVYAKYTAFAVYTVTFDSAVPGSTPTEISVTENEAEITLPEAPVWEGHTFLGWELEGEVYQPDATFTVEGNVTFTAKWELQEFTVTYKNGESVEYTAENVQWGTTHSVTYTIDDEETRHFLGWALEDEPTVVVTSVEVKSNITLIAVWEDKVTVQYFIDDASAPDKTEYIIKNNTTNGYTPAKSGYTFDGWYSDASCTGEKVVFPYNVGDDASAPVKFYGIYKQNVVLDQRDYFLVGGGTGSINNWEKTTALTFAREAGTNTYTLKNITLMENDQVKLRFNASLWGTTSDGSAYAFGAYFFSNFSKVSFVNTDGKKVFNASTAWDNNAIVAAGMSGIYNITLKTSGANTATTARQEAQIVLFEFELVSKISAETEDLGYFICGTSSVGWWGGSASAYVNYQLTTSDNGTTYTWSGTLKAGACKIIHVIKTNGVETPDYVYPANDQSTSAGNYTVTYKPGSNTGSFVKS